MISWIEADSSSAAAATVWTLDEASSEATATAEAWLLVSSALAAMPWAMLLRAAAAPATSWLKSLTRSMKRACSVTTAQVSIRPDTCPWGVRTAAMLRSSL
ncbi:hypothetical protein D3C87_1082810 [compost metagenome]